MQAPPCKRSQKLGDKITALQQLVSPYGKVSTNDSSTSFCAYMFSLRPDVSCLPIRKCSLLHLNESDVPADGYCVGAPGGRHLHPTPAPADPGEQILFDEIKLELKDAGCVNLKRPVTEAASYSLVFFLSLVSVSIFLTDSHGLLP
jgi:hypothetical protein